MLLGVELSEDALLFMFCWPCVPRCWGSAKGPQSVWGRLKEGWILLYDEASDWSPAVGGTAAGAARADWQMMLGGNIGCVRFVAGCVVIRRFSASLNPKRMVPVPTALRRLLVLAAGHASVQWQLLAELARFVSLKYVGTVAMSFCVSHLLVLQQLDSTVMWGVHNDDILDRQKKRLRPTPPRSILHFGLAVVAMALSLVIGIAASERPLPALLSCWALVAGTLLHALDLGVSLEGLDRWREPRLPPLFPAETLPSAAQWCSVGICFN